MGSITAGWGDLEAGEGHGTADRSVLRAGRCVIWCCAACRPIPLRIRHVERVTNEIAQWMQTRPEVKLVHHPALPSPGRIWKRGFTGSTGVFSFVLRMTSMVPTLRPLHRALGFFGIGAS